MYRAQLRSHGAQPTLSLNEASDLDWLIAMAKQAVELVGPNYHWCGIFDANNRLIRELTATHKVEVTLHDVSEPVFPAV